MWGRCARRWWEEPEARRRRKGSVGFRLTTTRACSWHATRHRSTPLLLLRCLSQIPATAHAGAREGARESQPRPSERYLTSHILPSAGLAWQTGSGPCASAPKGPLRRHSWRASERQRSSYTQSPRTLPPLTALHHLGRRRRGPRERRTCRLPECRDEARTPCCSSFSTGPHPSLCPSRVSQLVFFPCEATKKRWSRNENRVSFHGRFEPKHHLEEHE